MILTKDKGMRMWGVGGSAFGGSGGGGGINPSDLAGFVTMEFLKSLTWWGRGVPDDNTAIVGALTGVTDITMTGALTGATNVSTKKVTIGGFEIEYDSTNQALKFNGSIYATGGVSALGYGPGGGGGGVTALTDLVDVAVSSPANGQVLMYNSSTGKWYNGTVQGGGGGTVTSITAGTGLTGGTITDSGTIALSQETQANIAKGVTAYGWGNHAGVGYATQTWVANQGYATQTWVTGRGYITSSALSGYATQAWVNNQGFLTYNDITNYLKVGSDGVVEGGQYYDFHMQGTTSDFSTRLQVTADNRNTLTLPSASGTLATQEWVNSQGYLLRTEGMKFEARTGYLAARFVLADGSTYDTTRAALAQGSGYIEWWSTGGFFNHQMGNVSITDGANNTTCYLQIGGGRIYWDNQSKSLYVVQSDGSTPANLYATGGVSALGISTGGSPSVSSLTIGTLNVTSYADISNLTLQSDMNANSCNIEMEGGNITNVGDLTTGTLNVNGTTIKRIYWNGTYLQVQIGSSTYNFRPV